MALTFHFIAIGGAVMHQLAIFLHQQGNTVSGSDDVIFDPALTQLQKHGLAPAAFGWHPELLHPGIDAVILGMHARADNPELKRATELGLKILSFPEFIYDRSQDKTRVVVAGSHGKTTITSMIMHILREAGIDFDYLVGARIEGFDTMVKVRPECPLIILEGDEYLSSTIDLRSKFLHYHPQIAVISGIAWDHINVFPTMDSYLETFRQFIRTMDPSGVLYYYAEDEHLPELVDISPAKAIPYMGYAFEEKGGETRILDSGRAYPVQVFGAHNMENLKAAVSVCSELGVTPASSLRYMATFTGSAKRLELVHSLPGKGLYIYRDFAHAPSKLKASMKALRTKYAMKRIIGVFELHTYSTLQPEFLAQYAGAMDSADLPVAFLDEHALKIKGKEDIADETIRTCFKAPEIQVLRTAEDLQALLLKEAGEDTVIALMSSGNFANLDIPALFDLLIVNM